MQVETSLTDVCNNIVDHLKRKFLAQAWFCQIVPQACEVGLPTAIFQDGNYIILSFSKNGVEYIFKAGKIWEMRHAQMWTLKPKRWFKNTPHNYD